MIKFIVCLCFASSTSTCTDVTYMYICTVMACIMVRTEDVRTEGVAEEPISTNIYQLLYYNVCL